jgi:hypothetical protein
MEILLNKIDKEKLDKLIETKDINIAIADILLTSFHYPTLINQKELTRLVNDECFSYEAAIIKLMLEALEIDLDNEENEEIINDYFKNIKCLDTSEYIYNPYNKFVTPKEKRFGKYEIKYMSYKPFQLFPYDEITVESKYFKEISSIGYFKKEYKYLAILENNTVWMSLNPNEINTMKDDISSAKGHVLTFGLGLGYFPFMCSLKDEVSKITIIEKDQNIIDIFKNNLLPYFPNKDKIEIIKDDAFNFMNKKYKNIFDYVFVDIWHTPNDGVISYLKFKEFENRYNTKFHYWLEPSLKQNIRRAIITILQEYYEGYTSINYQKAETEFDELVNLLYKKLENQKFLSFDQILKICE